MPTNPFFDFETNTLRWIYSEGSYKAQVLCKYDGDEDFKPISDTIETDYYHLEMEVGTKGKLKVEENDPDPEPPWKQLGMIVDFEIQDI